MSVDVGKQIKFLADTSCMNVEERVNLAHLEVARKFFEDDSEFVQFLNEVAVPFVTLTGRAKWQRDIVTDLGLALSLRKEREAKVDKVLEFDPSAIEKELVKATE